MTHRSLEKKTAYSRLSFLVLILFTTTCTPTKMSVGQNEKIPTLTSDEKRILQNIEQHGDHYGQIAQQIWQFAELDFREFKSAQLLQRTLEAEGFSVQSGVAGMPTAFVAEYGSGKPVIGILAEYDALPGVSQEAVPYRQAREGNAAGHACGHHLFGTGSVAAAIAVKEWLQQSGQTGTIRLYGTPAEETAGGKVYMVREGLLDDVDVALHWHPSSVNDAGAGTSTATKEAKFRFYGQASHAAGAPERGRSALDGVEAMTYMVNLMREHVPQETRIHYVITRGGEAPNVVPAFAEVYLYARHPKADVVKGIFDRIVDAAEGAAKGTGTRMEYEVVGGLHSVLPNETLQRKMHEKLSLVGGIQYTAEEKAFAEKIIATFENSDARPEMAAEIVPYALDHGAGSTDVGDVSWVVPTAGVSTATWAPGTSAHSWQAVAAGGTSIGQKGMLAAAKAMAIMAVELYQNPAMIEAAKQELLEKRGPNFRYESLQGDREPPIEGVN